MIRIAIFGGNGYLGSQLAAYLSAQGTSYDVFDVPDFDVTDTGCWDSFKADDYSAILFFAGMTGTEKSFMAADRFCAVNENGLLGLLKRLAPLGERAPKIIFPSSRLVYKGAETALVEDSPKEAKTVYAANKLACEYLLQAYGFRYGLKYAVVRICVPWGSIVSTEYSYGTVGFFVHQAKASGCITLYGDGSLRRTFTHVADICEAINRVIMSDRLQGIFNIGGVTYSLADAAGKIAAAKGAKLSYVPWPENALRVESGSTFFDSSSTLLA